MWRRDLSSPLTEFLGIATVALLLWYGSRQVFSGEMDAASFLTFIFAFYLIIDPAKKFSKAWYNVQKGLGAMQRVDTVLEVKNPLLGAAAGAGERKEAKPVDSHVEAQQGLVFHNVGFRYTQNGPLVLNQVNLSLPKGKILALAGSSGGGKSTIADLFPRFYDPTSGSITLDGKDLRDYPLAELRSRFGIVSQEAILFNDTIYNNIVFGLEGVSRAQVEDAARIANAHDFIKATPQGYQTNIGDRGAKLSGGQRQRLTIARAILRNPDILILDEATSALDSESERLVQDALQKLLVGRTA
ncbi:MAG: ATP-binding cassette domain-containing protein, partial [Bacteroidota bacterium]